MEIIHSKKLSFNRESGESQLHILIVHTLKTFSATTIPLNYSASVKRRVSSTLRSRRYFFLVDIDGWRRSHVNEGRSAERKSTVYFKIGILRKDLWSQGKFQVIIVKSLENKEYTLLFCGFFSPESLRLFSFMKCHTRLWPEQEP